MTPAASILLAVLLNPGASQDGAMEMEFPAGSVQHAVPADDVPWRPCPPSLPSGCEIAVLEGDPQGSGLFTVRFRLQAGVFMPPHSHPNNERATILDGRLAVAFGEDARRDDAREFGPGDYYVNARGAVHSVWADEISVVQLTGIGPWRADYVTASP